MTTRNFVTIAIIVAAGLLASAVIAALTPGTTWLAFLGWTLFFVSLQTPFMFSRSAREHCLPWLNRSHKRS